MRWSKVKKLVEERFAPSVRGRAAVYSTRYGGCSCGRGWITLDGNELADLNTLLAWEHYGRPGLFDEHRHSMLADEMRTPGKLVEPGEFTRFQLHEACWEYLHSSVNASLASSNPLVKSLAVLDARVGKRRLDRLAEENLHPLTRALLEFRIEAERQHSAGNVPVVVAAGRS